MVERNSEEETNQTKPKEVDERNDREGSHLSWCVSARSMEGTITTWSMNIEDKRRNGKAHQWRQNTWKQRKITKWTDDNQKQVWLPNTRRSGRQEPGIMNKQIELMPDILRKSPKLTNEWDWRRETECKEEGWEAMQPARWHQGHCLNSCQWGA